MCHHSYDAGKMREVEKQDILQKLTIVIPTYDRQAFALRNMRYWSGKLAKVIVVDGTDKPIDAEAIKTLRPNIEYYHLPITVNERLQFAVDRIATPYAMLCGDDEFMVPSGVIECISFLENNAEYAQCGARAVGFSLKKKYLDLYEVKPMQRHHRVEQDTPLARIRYHIENFTPSTIYSVHRAPSFRLAILSSIRYQYSNGGYTGELIVELISAAVGKSRVLPSAMWIRSSENEPVQHEGWDRKLHLPEWYDDPTYAQEVEKMYEILTDTVCFLDHSLDRSETYHSITEIINNRLDRVDRPGLERIYKRATPPRIVSALLFVKRLIKHALISWAPKLAGLMVSNYYRSKQFCSYKSMITRGEIRFSDINELNDIWETVLEFHAINSATVADCSK